MVPRLKNIFEHSTYIKIVLLVASQLLKYPVSFIFMINLSTASSTNFVRSVLQDSVNLAHYTCLSTGFLVDDNAG